MSQVDFLDTDATAAALQAGECRPAQWSRLAGQAVLLLLLAEEIPQPRVLMGGGFSLYQILADDHPRAKLAELFEDPFNVGQWHLGLLKLGLFLGFMVVALILAYVANRRGDGREFWWRLTALTCPVGMLTAILAVFVYPLIFQPLARAIMEQNGWGMFGPAGDSFVPWHGMIFMVLMEGFFCWRLWRAMTLAARPAPRAGATP